MGTGQNQSQIHLQKKRAIRLVYIEEPFSVFYGTFYHSHEVWKTRQRTLELDMILLRNQRIPLGTFFSEIVGWRGPCLVKESHEGKMGSFLLGGRVVVKPWWFAAVAEAIMAGLAGMLREHTEVGQCMMLSPSVYKPPPPSSTHPPLSSLFILFDVRIRQAGCLVTAAPQPPSTPAPKQTPLPPPTKLT